MMRVTFRVEQYAAAIEPAMAPGESALWIPDASYLIGTIEHIAPPVVAPSVGELRTTLEMLAAGTALVGYDGSRAMTLCAAIDEVHHGGADGELVVTDQRLIVLDHLMKGAEVIWECPRDAVVGARITSGLGHAGRTVVVFADGSGLALLLGVVFRAGAEHFVAELSQGLELT
jgi:hypothetical protein